MADFFSVDEALAKNDQATKLTLEGEGDVLPEGITQLVNLRELDLERWRVSTVPPWFARLDKLEVLKLGAPFEDKRFELPSVILELPQLRELHLSGFSLPDEIARCSKLEVLRALGGKGTRLPSTLGQLTKLRVLAVIGQHITELPDAIATFGGLEELDVGGNPIGVLPEWIGLLSHIRTLGFMNTKLRTVPESIGAVTELQTLQLNMNAFARLPASIGRLTKLEHIAAQNGELVELPREIGALTRLGALYLSDNKLRSLPDEIGDLGRLFALGLDRNQLSAVPETLAHCKQLRWLSLEGNTFGPEEVARLQRIVAPFKKKLKTQWPHTATVREPTYAGRLLSANVLKQIERLGGRMDARETPGEPVVEKLPSGEVVLPEAIRQWWRDVTWPAGTKLRGTIMEGWGPVTLDMARIYVELTEYKCAKRSPYYPMASEDDHQVHYLCSLDDSKIDDPWLYRLDGHGWDDEHPLRTGKHLSQMLAKLEVVPGAEMRALVRDIRSKTGAARVEATRTLAALTPARLVSLQALSQLRWLLENGADPADPEADVAIRLAALTAITKLKKVAVDCLPIVRKVGETHPDPTVRAQCTKTAKRLTTTKKK